MIVGWARFRPDLAGLCAEPVIAGRGRVRGMGRGRCAHCAAVSAGPTRTAVARGTTVQSRSGGPASSTTARCCWAGHRRACCTCRPPRPPGCSTAAHRHRRRLRRARPSPDRRGDRAPGRRAARPPSAAASDVTVVIPVKDRTDGLARLLAALDDRRHRGLPRSKPRSRSSRPRPCGGTGRRRAAGLRVIVVDDGSADPAAVGRSPRPGPGPAASLSRGPGRRPQCRARRGHHAAGRLPRLRRRPRARLARPLLARLADPAVGLVAPRIVALPPVTGWLGRYEAVRSSLDLGADPALVVPRSRVAYVPSAAMLVRRAAVGAGFDAGCTSPRTSTSSCGCTLRAGGCRYEPAARVAHDHRTIASRLVAAQGVLRDGRRPARPAPPRRGAADGGEPLVGGDERAAPPRPPRRGGTSRRRRLPPVRQAPPPAAPARTTAVAPDRARCGRGRCADRRRRHPPLLATRRTRRLVLPTGRRTVVAVAVGSGVVDWLRAGPERAALPAFLLARRLDDLAYGVGLWWGAAAHRTRRAAAARRTHREGYSERLKPGSM